VWFAVHFFFYWSVVRFYAVSGPVVKKLIFLSAVLLSVSFAAAAFLARAHAGPAAGAFYAFAAFWAGFALYLFMAASACWLLYLTGRVAGRQIPMRAVCSLSFALTFVVSAYGVWNAFSPVMKNIEVEIPGLPDGWRRKTIVQVSDIHLGAVHTRGWFSRAAAKINSISPDVIFITGDLFDGMSAGDLSMFTDALNELKAKDGIFFVTGNHENYIGVDKVLAALAKTRIRTLRDEAVQVDGLQIAGLNYPGYGGQRDVKGLLSGNGFKKGMPSVLLFHTPTNIARNSVDFAERQTNTYWAPDVDFTAAKELGISLQLSGHTHKGQLFPFGLLSGFLYKGYDYGLHRQGGFFIYTTSGLGTFGPPMRVGGSPEIVIIRLKPAESF
ncbi:MAG: metallophosphoesterase, partial [Deltaproteobacteria bacterium]|nr:metallophosphoesterase [Deltaproteobacteria bacterium]